MEADEMTPAPNMLKNALGAALAAILALALTSPSEARGRAYRPHYSGSHHTVSHGGRYFAGRGSAHKGGHYVNPRTANHYGRHKR